MDFGQVLCRVSEVQSGRRPVDPRLLALGRLADAPDDLAHPTLWAVRIEPSEGVAGLADSPAIGGVQLLPGGSMRPAQHLSKVHNSL